MKLLLSGLVAFVYLLLAGCATNPNQPDWVSGNSAEFKNSRYLIGRGQASNVEDAKKRAHADLAEIFQVAISVESEDTQSYKSNSKLEGGTGKLVRESSLRISTQTNQIISGILIAQIWLNTDNNTYYVLAILPRQQAEESLRQQINQLDAATFASINRTKDGADLFLKISTTSKAIELQLEREGLQRALQVVDITGKGVAPKYSSAKLKVELADLLSQLKIAVKVLDGSVSGFEEVVSGALSKAGFLIDTGEKPDFLLKAGLKLSAIEFKDGWYWQRGNLEISVSEAASGRVRGSQRWPVKSSATDKNAAVRRALDEANTVLKKELGDAIVGMATSP